MKVAHGSSVSHLREYLARIICNLLKILRKLWVIESLATRLPTDSDPALPAYRQSLGRQNEMVRDFHGIGVERLNVIGLFEADQNLQGGEGERLCCVNDWTAGAVPASPWKRLR